MSKPKIIALYLPQFHQIPENDKFWGKGFTDWKLVKEAQPLFENHQQPNQPLNDNYYDLSEEKNIEWQCNLAKEYEIYGFGVYHYWFNDNQNLLTKPAEFLRDNKSIDTKYFLIWDNGNWIRSWSNAGGNDWSPILDQNIKSSNESSILIEYKLGAENNWKKHYDYVRNHFFSPNYEKINNKPIFGIIHFDNDIHKMCKYWNELARKDGFDGIHFVCQNKYFLKRPEEINYDLFFYNYQPHYSSWYKLPFAKRAYNGILRRLKIKNRKKTEQQERLEEKIYFYSFRKIWKNILKNAKRNNRKDIYFGAFVGYDDTPRRGNKRSRVILQSNPADLYKYLKKLIKISSQKNKDYIFLTAWNEWSEGAFIEPDKKNKFSYLEAVRKAINS